GIAMSGKSQRPRARPSGRPAPRVQPARSGTVLVELICVGQELLDGRIANTGAQTVARSLTGRGAFVRRITVVEDAASTIAAALRETLSRNPNLVVTTGGLGPAEDDHTLEGVAAALALPLSLHHDAKALVETTY